jgi:hypothetical protein
VLSAVWMMISMVLPMFDRVVQGTKVCVCGARNQGVCVFVCVVWHHAAPAVLFAAPG